MNRPVCEPGLPGPVDAFQSTGDCETFGYSVGGLPLTVNYAGDPAAGLRIFILAGQHGDEPDARQAATAFLARLLTGGFRAPVRAAVVADANPDGAAAGTRRNGIDVDLNRDHLLLRAPETSAVHALVDRWQPHLIIDVHTYRPWRRELLQYDFVFPQEIMIDFPTNPAVRTAMGPAFQMDALDFVKRRLAESAIRCDRYTLIRSGIVRHSNADIIDARNNMALRFDVPTVLIEGRRASPDDSVIFTSPVIALLRSIEAVVDWATQIGGLMEVRPSRSTMLIPVRCRHAESKTPHYMEMQSATRGSISTVQIPGRYLPFVKATRIVRMPNAYAVPHNLAGVLATLGKLRFETAPASQFHASMREVYRVESLSLADDDDSPAFPCCALQAGPVNLDDFVVFATRQPGGRLLTLLLEPESQFGPQRLPELAEALQPGMLYPVVRVL